MTANIVPLLRRFHAQLAMGFCLVATVAVALGTGWAGASPAPTTAHSVDDEPLYSRTQHDLLWGDEFDAPPPQTSPQHYGRYLTLDARPLQFDEGAGVDGSGALRISWSTADGTRARCADDSRLLEASFPAAKSLTVSFWLRYSPGFVFDWSGRSGCGGNAKKMFLLWAEEGSRFVFISENGVLGLGSDHDHPLLAQNAGVAVTPSALADGEWHRVTMRIRQGSSATAADGSVHAWIDGVLRWRYNGIVTHNAGGYYLFKMPATFNSGSPVVQTEWLDRLQIWRDQ